MALTRPGTRAWSSAPRRRRAASSRSDPLGTPDWDAWVGAHPEAVFFHSRAWLETLQEAYGMTPAAWGARRPGRPPALVLLMEARSGLLGRRGVSLPFADECPLLAPPGVSAAPGAACATEAGRRRGWRSVEWRGGRAVFAGARPSTTYWVHEQELEDNPERMWGRLDSSARRAVRKARGQGLTVEVARGPEALREYYRLHCLTRRGHGLPPQPWRFFRAAGRHVLDAGAGDVVLARLGQRAVGGAVFFRFGSKVLYKYGASDPAFQAWRPNNLVMWTAIGHYAALGARRLHWGRTSLGNEGLRRFKLGWGATEATLDYFKYDLRREEFVVEPDRTSGWHTRLFRRLPVSALRLAGALLYRYLA